MNKKESKILGWFFLAGSVVSYFFVYPSQIIVDESELISSDFFPNICIICIALLSLLFLKEGYGRDNIQPVESDSAGVKFRQSTFWSTVGVLLLYIFCLEILGFLISTVLVLFYFLRKIGNRKWWLNIAISLGTTAVVYIIFQMSMKIFLPQGIILSYFM